MFDLGRRLNFLTSFFLCWLATLLALHQLDYPLIGIDDANIYFVYARNVADGHGFVYNVGGERIEGFTSLLWTLITALAFKLSTRAELILLIVNTILVSLGATLALDHIQHHATTSKAKIFWSVFFLVVLFTSPRYIVWTTLTLMENALWIVLLLKTTLFVIHEHASHREINLGFISLSILLILTRPESMLWIVVFVSILFIQLALAQTFSSALKILAPSFIASAVAVALLTIFRLYYFGYPLPNTYYAKVSPSLAYNLEQGLIYLIRYFLSDPVSALGVTIVLAGCIYSILRLRPTERTYFLPCIAAAGLLFPLLTGGDHFGSFRFYQNIFPIIILCFIYCTQRAIPLFEKFISHLNLSLRVHRAFSMGAILAVLLVFSMAQVRAWNQFVPEIQVEFNVANYERANGAFAQKLFSSLPRLPSIGVIASGGIKYSYEGEIIDLLGLNNITMAHNDGNRLGYKNHAAFEIETFYQLQPDIVWPLLVHQSNWQYSEADLRERWETTLGFKGLFNEARFLEFYSYAKVDKNASADQKALVAWFRKDFLQHLKVDPVFLVEEYHYSP